MNNPKLILCLVVVSLSLAANVFFAARYAAVQKELRETQAALETKKTNDKVLEFTKLFIEEVLKAKTEVDFDTRLQLENAVRGIGDEEILTQWQKFTETKTEVEAQQEVKNLLEMLINKIKVK